MEGNFSIEESNTPNILIKLTWILAGLATAACLIRNDYNVLFSFLILVILNRHYKENTRYYSKILIHLLLALVIVDILWLIIIMPYWSSKNTKNAYWESLSGAHTFALTLAFLELLLKAGMAGIVFLQYKKTHPNDIAELFKPNYTLPASQIVPKPNNAEIKEYPDTSARS